MRKNPPYHVHSAPELGGKKERKGEIAIVKKGDGTISLAQVEAGIRVNRV